MNKLTLKNNKVRRLTLAAMLTAIVVILQLLGSAIRFGVFSVSLVLVPIVIGAALLGMVYGAWLGFAFSLTVLLSGDAAPFLAVSAFGTVVTVLLKGTLAGLCAAFVYRLTEKSHPYLSVVLAAIVCPVVNTGIFLIGCRVFFWETISGWATAAGFASAGTYVIVGLAGLNFVFELAVNVLLAPVIARLIGYFFLKEGRGNGKKAQNIRNSI